MVDNRLDFAWFRSSEFPIEFVEDINLKSSLWKNEEVNKIIHVHGPKVLWALAELFLFLFDDKLNCVGDFECRDRAR